MDEIEMQKRANYFDLRRDEFMALEEYLLSGLSDKDLGRAEGGLASLPGYNDGGMLLKDRMAKITSNLASVRFDKDLYFKLIKDAGYVKDDGSADIKKFNRAANRVGIDVKDRSARNMQKITKFLNLKSRGSYKNVGMFSAKSIAENAASQSEGFLGQYAEKYSAATKEDFWNDAKKLQRKVNKLKISSAEKVKEIARGLKLRWAVPIGITSTLLTKMGFGAMGHLITTEMGSGELPKESMADQAVKNIDFSGPSANTQLLEQLSQDAVMNKRGGGMTDIYEMTQPLGYRHGGEHRIVPRHRQKKEITIEQIIKDAEASKDPGEPGRIGKWWADKYPVEPIHQMKENIIDKGKRTVKGIGRGISGLVGIGQELLGAGPVEAGTFTEDLDTNIRKLETEIKSLQIDEMLMGEDNSKAIQSKSNLLEYYRSLQ